MPELHGLRYKACEPVRAPSWHFLEPGWSQPLFEPPDDFTALDLPEFVCSLLMMNAGTPGMFVISIDLEMSWGSIHHRSPRPAEHLTAERDVIDHLLQLLGDYEISATWATVGHLFLDECGPFESVKHPEVVRPIYAWHTGDWFELDPVDRFEVSPSWYAPDVIDRIVACPTHQEIGSHSFSHMIAGDPGCSVEAFSSDLDASVTAGRQYGLELKSFVFPRNSIGHVETLAGAGFTAYRGGRPDPFAERPIWQRRLLRAIEIVRPNTTSAVYPKLLGEIVDVPQTYLFDPESRIVERFGVGVWTRVMMRRLYHASRTQSLFHLWFHPHNIVARQDRAWPALTRLFESARTEIDSGRLRNFTMEEVAKEMIGSDVN